MAHLIMKVIPSNRITRKGFLWPKVGGIVTAPDWSDEPECGGGLHGWLNGDGDHFTQTYSESPDAIWLAIVTDSIVDLCGKVKFQKGLVVFEGSAGDVASYIHERRPGVGVMHLTLTGGHCSTLTGGYGSTLTGGDDSALTGGHHSALTGGDDSTLTSGDDSTLTSGRNSTLTGGHCSTLTSGYGSTLIFKTPFGISVAVVGQHGVRENTPYMWDTLPSTAT